MTVQTNERICGNDCKDEWGNCTIPGDDGLPVQCVGPWVEDKYSFLGRYVGATRFARKKFTDKGNSVYIDLFAGPGRCVIKNEKVEKENGAIRVYREQSIPFTEYHLFDISPVNEHALNERIGTTENCNISCCDSNVHTPELVRKLLEKPYRYHLFI